MCQKRVSIANLMGISLCTTLSTNQAIKLSEIEKSMIKFSLFSVGSDG